MPVKKKGTKTTTNKTAHVLNLITNTSQTEEDMEIIQAEPKITMPSPMETPRTSPTETPLPTPMEPEELQALLTPSNTLVEPEPQVLSQPEPEPPTPEPSLPLPTPEESELELEQSLREASPTLFQAEPTIPPSNAQPTTVEVAATDDDDLSIQIHEALTSQLIADLEEENISFNPRMIKGQKPPEPEELSDPEVPEPVAEESSVQEESVAPESLESPDSIEPESAESPEAAEPVTEVPSEPESVPEPSAPEASSEPVAEESSEPTAPEESVPETAEPITEESSVQEEAAEEVPEPSSEPESVQEESEPEPAEPVAEVPSAPEAAPEVTEPEPITEESSVPEESAPEVPEPVAEVPSVQESAPETPVPEPTAPEVAEESAPEPSAPEVAEPEPSAPEVHPQPEAAAPEPKVTPAVFPKVETTNTVSKEEPTEDYAPPTFDDMEEDVSLPEITLPPRSQGTAPIMPKKEPEVPFMPPMPSVEDLKPIANAPKPPIPPADILDMIDSKAFDMHNEESALAKQIQGALSEELTVEEPPSIFLDPILPPEAANPSSISLAPSAPLELGSMPEQPLELLPKLTPELLELAPDGLEELDPNRKHDVTDHKNPMVGRRLGEPVEYYNLTEILVRDLAPSSLQTFGTCTCDQCLLDVIAHCLGLLPPKYVVRYQGGYEQIYEAYKQEYGSAIVSQLGKSCIFVNESPRHLKAFMVD